MTMFPLGPDPARTRLRATLARIERALSALPLPANSETAAAVADASPLTDLHTSWDDLVSQLALGPEPALRPCPRCHQLGMRAATRCGHCWTSVEPLSAEPHRSPTCAASPR